MPELDNKDIVLIRDVLDYMCWAARVTGAKAGSYSPDELYAVLAKVTVLVDLRRPNA